MVGNNHGGRSGDESTPAAVVVRQIAPDSETAEYDLLEIIAGLEECVIEDLPSLYLEVDHFIQSLFETPPSRESQVTISFSYAGYRITITQDGAVELVPVKASLEE